MPLKTTNPGTTGGLFLNDLRNEYQCLMSSIAYSVSGTKGFFRRNGVFATKNSEDSLYQEETQFLKCDIKQIVNAPPPPFHVPATARLLPIVIRTNPLANRVRQFGTAILRSCLPIGAECGRPYR